MFVQFMNVSRFSIRYLLVCKLLIITFSFIKLMTFSECGSIWKIAPFINIFYCFGKGSVISLNFENLTPVEVAYSCVFCADEILQLLFKECFLVLYANFFPESFSKLSSVTPVSHSSFQKLSDVMTLAFLTYLSFYNSSF